jgi:glucose-6-phosphate isomerase
MNTLISLDYNYAMADVLGTTEGIGKNDLDDLEKDAEKAASRIRQERDRGELSFLDINALQEHVPAIKATAEIIRGRFKKLVVLGIGGSALGARAIQEALVDNLNKGDCEVVVADNIDPSVMARLIDSLDLRSTAFNVISKSGGTVETLAQFMIIANLLKKGLGEDDFRSRLVITTDPEKGVLREIAREEGIASLEVDPKIGGRFSVLTPVGLFPAECMGVDSGRILAGAGEFLSSVGNVNWKDNPAYLFGAIQYIAATVKRRNISVLMPYSGTLFSLALWYCQLWAESLGKKKQGGQQNEEGVGQTPVPAVGVTDQHSQLQLYMEGPHDKILAFLRVENQGADVTIPRIYEGRQSMDYLGLKGLGDLFEAERAATEAALARAGRPSMTLTVPDVSPETIGVIFSFFQMATVFAGYLYGIDPFGQPGVEEGKKYTWGIMGRNGYDDKLSEYNDRPKKVSEYFKAATGADRRTKPKQ